MFISKIINSCFFGHKWEKWQCYEAEMMSIFNGKEYNYSKTKQSRRCIKCGKIQISDLDYK